MEIKQEKTFEPLIIKIETAEEYITFEQIIDEANNVNAVDRRYMDNEAAKMAIFISDWLSDNA